MPYLQPRSQNATIDANGNATVSWQIDNTNQRWIVDYVTVQTNQAQNATPIPQCRFYKNLPGQPQAFVGGTNSGQMDTATGRVVLFPDDVLYAVWSGGIPGTVATGVIGGTFDRAGVPIED